MPLTRKGRHSQTKSLCGGYIDRGLKARLVTILKREGIGQPEWIAEQAARYVANYEKRHGKVRVREVGGQRLFQRATAKQAIKAYLNGKLPFGKASRLAGLDQDVFLKAIDAHL